MSRDAALFQQLAVLADPMRTRLLLLLERHELAVSELCAVVQAPQPTVSRHLKALADAGWVASRADGTHRRYAAALGGLPAADRALWVVVRREAQAGRAAAQDERRLGTVLAARRTRSREFFTGAADRWDATRDALFGPGFFLQALPALLEPASVAGDLGCGTGQIAEALAPWVSRVIAVDESAAMLRAARRRLGGLPHVELRRGDLAALPVETASLDVATLVLVLHHLPDPAPALREAARALKPGGRLLIVDMLPHDRDEYRRTMGHAWLGFSRDQIGPALEDAGLGAVTLHPLASHPKSRGPALFAARAQRHDVESAGAASPAAKRRAP